MSSKAGHEEPDTAMELQQGGDDEEPPSAVVTEEDGHICDMAMSYGAKLGNESGTRYEFTEAQLLAFTKANRQPV